MVYWLCNFLAQVLHCWRVKWFLHRRKPWRKLRTGLQNGGANHFAGLALAVSGFENEHLNFALATPDGTFALRVRFSTTRYSLAIRQEVCAMMALNMLRRWLNGQDIASEHGWIEVVESMTLSV
ncbi:putative molybdopterin-binding protein [Escherichia coli]|uniref:Putative molybdopterin-binding protein n=1 Tax=Escherichia coli TaxID=562 RepID=A0A377DQY1_ECOLX|nr:putative molybdopterin-binding protein [Escherichia coli]